jgi:hypothetical protein
MLHGAGRMFSTAPVGNQIPPLRLGLAPWADRTPGSARDGVSDISIYLED